MYKPYLFCLYVWTNEYILYKYAAGYHSAKVLTRTLVLVASTDVWEYSTKGASKSKGYRSSRVRAAGLE